MMLSSHSPDDSRIEYAYVVPLKAGDYAYLHRRRGIDTTLVPKKANWVQYEDPYMEMYLEEIKNGNGNWIISPQNSNSDLEWEELDFKNCKILKRLCTIKYEILGA